MAKVVSDYQLHRVNVCLLSNMLYMQQPVITKTCLSVERRALIHRQDLILAGQD
jgi:hypothetical protein